MLATAANDTAKIFKNGQSQAVRIPKKFRFENQNEVLIKKVGDSIVLTPKTTSPWDIMFEAADKISDDFMEDGRNQPESQVREDIF